MLPDDGIIDRIAVEISAGRLPWRPVPLTEAEQRAAAAMIRADGGGIPAICARLRVSASTAAALLPAESAHCPTCRCADVA